MFGFYRQWIWLQKRVDSFSIWFWFGFWLILFVFSSWFYYNALARTFLSLLVQLFGEARAMKGFIFGLLHRAFQRRKRVGRRKKRNGKQYQASELSSGEKRYGQAGLPDEPFHPGSFAHFLPPTMNTSWALVLKTPQWDTSHKQIIR